MIIDCHTHIGKNYSVDMLLKSMDKAGIDKALVFAGQIHDNSIGCTNEYLLEQIKHHNDRLYGVACYHPSDNIVNLSNLLANNANIVAVKFYLGYDHWYPNDDRIYQALNVCEYRNRPVIFHCGDCLCTVKAAKLRYAHPLGVDDPATDFPNVKMVIAHFGWPWTTDAALVCKKNKNVYADISGFVYGEFDQDDSNAYSNSFEFEVQIADFEITAGGTDKLLFGTDWPISDQSSYIQICKEKVFDDEPFKMITETNPMQIFGIK